MNEKKISTIFFDIGNVLVHFSFEKMCRQIGEVSGLSLNEVYALLAKNDLAFRFEKGEVTTEEMYSIFLEHGSKTPAQETLVRAMSDIFHPNETIYPIVRGLKERGIRLILLSNTCEVHFEHLQKFPIINLFDEKILSYEVKARKPEREIFKAALDMANCEAESCFYTDDILEYIKAARSLGIDAEPYKDAATLVTHLGLRNIAAK